MLYNKIWEICFILIAYCLSRMGSKLYLNLQVSVANSYIIVVSKFEKIDCTWRALYFLILCNQCCQQTYDYYYLFLNENLERGKSPLVWFSSKNIIIVTMLNNILHLRCIFTLLNIRISYIFSVASYKKILKYMSQMATESWSNIWILNFVSKPWYKSMSDIIWVVLPVLEIILKYRFFTNQRYSS